MSTIIDSLKQPIPMREHVQTVRTAGGELVIKPLATKPLPSGIYMLTLKGMGVLYLGISSQASSASRKGVKQRWLSHAYKLTGLGFKGDRAGGQRLRGGKVADTAKFAEFRRDAVLAGWDLDTVLDHIEIRFVPMAGQSQKRIDIAETLLLMQLIARGQCKLNGAKRQPALTQAEVDYIVNVGWEQE